jgi:hypothetical protein
VGPRVCPSACALVSVHPSASPCACSAAGRDSWARVRSGLYKDDLARVVDVDYAAGKATIEVAPRIDYAALANKDLRVPFGKQPKIRPAARFVCLSVCISVVPNNLREAA